MGFDLREYIKERDKKESGATGQQTSNEEKRFDLRSYVLSKDAKNVASHLSDRVNTWIQNSNNYISSYNSRLEGRKPGTYVSDSDDWMKSLKKQKSSFDAERESILAMVEKYGEFLDQDWKSSVVKAMKGADLAHNYVLSSAEKDRSYWNQFLPNAEQAAAGYTAEDLYNSWYKDDTYRKKYSGKSYDELQALLGQMEDGEEKSWVTDFAPSVMTSQDYDKRIAEAQGQTSELEMVLKEMTSIADQINMSGGVDKATQARYKALISKYGTMQELEAKIEGLKSENWNLTNEQKYRFLPEKEDFAKLSTQVADERTAGFGIGIGTSWWGKGDPLYDYINDIDNERTRVAGASAMRGSPYTIYSNMTDQEVATYNYLYNAEGKDSAQEYLDYLKYDLSEMQQGTARVGAEKLANEAPFLASALSVPANLMSGVGALDVAWQNAVRDFTGEYKPINYNNSSMTPTVMSSTIRGTVAQNIADSTGTIKLDETKHPVLSRILNGKSLGDVYQLGMSMVDSAAVAAMSPVLGTAGTALLGGSAASQGILDAVAAGASDDQALALGLLNGGFEMLFEKFSLENLLKGDTKSIVKKIVQQGLVEGSEEFNTTLANTLADTIIMADKSQLQTSIAAYMDQGLSEQEATQKALTDIAIQMGWDFVGGVLTGGIMGGAAAPIQNYQYASAEGNRIYGSDPGALVSEALEIDPSNKLAAKMQGKLDGGKTVSGNQLYKLAQQNETALRSQDMASIQSAAESRLTELGETGDVKAIGTALAKQAAGQKLSKAEQQVLSSSKYGQRVANELNTENIDSGDYSSDWTGSLDTQRINVKEYSRLLQEAETAPEASRAKPAEASEEITVPEGDFTAEVETASESAPVPYNVLATKKETPTTRTEMVSKVAEKQGKAASIQDYATAYGGQAQAMIATYNLGGGSQNVKQFAQEYEVAFNWGNSGVSASYLSNPDTQALTGHLTEAQRDLAYQTGKDAAQAGAKAQTEQNRLTGRGSKGWKEGSVKGVGVAVSEVETAFATHNKSQRKAISVLRGLAKVTGIDIVLYKSTPGKDGFLQGQVIDGVDLTDAQGAFAWKNDKLYIDINAGLENAIDFGDVAKYAMLRTFNHEFTHFCEKWNPEEYVNFRELVFEHMTRKGTNVHALIEAKQTDGMSYEKASREVVAEGMTDILPETSFAQELAEKHQNLFQQLLAKLKEFLQDIKEYFAGLADNMDDGAAALKEDADGTIRYIEEIVQAYDKLAMGAVENYQAAMQAVIKQDAKAVPAAEIITDGATVTDGEGTQYSIRSMKADIAEGKMFEDLKTYCNWTQAQVDELRKQLVNLVEYMTPHRDILDMNETYGREGRRFSPYKPNSDPLYKISMDFSTLCSKRLLTQFVIENLQLRENRPMSAEEQMAIRNMLIEYRKQEKGLQVACAMCYVEAARLKAPQQMTKWMDDPGTQMANYFADKNPEFAAYIKEKQADFKESKGYDRNATKKDMSPRDRAALNKIRPNLRSEYKPSAEEQAVIDRAKELPNSTYLTAANLAKLSETDPAIYTAYTAFVRTATRSKSLETDEPYYYGDSTRDNGNGIIVSDSFIESVNRENGMRFSSWSDWRIVHMLDYITAVIDNSVRGAAMHGYTKFGDEVRVLGKTGMMFNMSGVAGSQTGLNPDGTLNFSPTESIDADEAIQLREEFPETAGLQCIGVSDEHIFALLRSDIIDYIIPYHVSGLNAALRRMADIHGWNDYTSTQHAAIDKSIKYEDAVDKEHWHEEPVYSEFFVGYNTGMTGIEAMKASADNYKRMCKERGLHPKFEKFASEDNYWKLLIDRKMINQKTGKLIQQKPVQPIFDFDAIKRIVDQHVSNYDSNMEARALNHIIENWDSIPQRIKDLKKGGTKKAKTQKALAAMDVVANEMLAAQGKVSKQARSSGQIPQDLQRKLLNKKPVSVSSAVWAKVKDARIDRYRGWEESDIPDIDFLPLAEYNKVNTGYLYTVRNYSRDSFAVIRRTRLQGRYENYFREEDVDGGSVQRTGTGNDQQGNNQAGWNAGNAMPGDQGAVPADALRSQEGGNAEPRNSSGIGGTDSGERSVNQKVSKQTRSYAPTFYSLMAKVVDGVKQEKLGAASVVSMLRGKGVKAEEIKWSGIETWLEGKKSVTKAELQEFIAGSMLQIEEETLSDQEIPYSQEHQDLIAKYEAERDTIAENLKSEWKRIVGTDIPITYFGSGLDRVVVDKLLSANSAKKGETEAGYQYKAARAALQRCIEYNDDYFGYDNAKQAFMAAVRDPKDFMKAYEMTSFEEGVFRDFIKAKDAYSKVEGIPMQDQKALKAIAESAERFNRRISQVKSEHRAKAAKHFTKWGQYKIRGGSNYRELLFKIPGSAYYNDAMDMHWDGKDGVLAHARMQDLNTFLGKMLFIEEIQSDWHNDGHKDGYASEEQAVRQRVNDLAKQLDDLLDESMTASPTRSYAIGEKMDAIHTDKERIEAKLRDGRLAPDAPFRDTYHEYVLKRLLRMAAEQDYDSIGWTTAQIQVDRWSEKFAEGYRIEYDQDIPKFLNKYGKKWGTSVGKTTLDNGTEVWSMAITDEMKESVLYEGQVQFQKRTNTLSDREVLEIAAYRMDFDNLNEGERAALKIFQERLEKLKGLQLERERLGSLWHEQQFGGGERAEAPRTLNRMRILDKQAERAMADVLSVEDKQVLKRVLQKARAVIKEDTTEHYRGIIERRKDRSHQAEMRQKIFNVVDELNRLLLRGDKKHHVPESMKKAVAEALNAINAVDTRPEDRAARIDNQLAELYRQKVEIQRGLTDENSEEMAAKLISLETEIQTLQKRKASADRMKDRLKDLRDAYEEISKGDDPDFVYAYDEVVASAIDDAVSKIGNTPLKEMSSTQLEMLYDVYRMVLSAVRNANKSFVQGKNESMYSLISSTIREVRAAGGSHDLLPTDTDAVRKLLWNNQKPVYAMEKIGSDTFTGAFWSLIDGEGKYAKDVTHASSFADEAKRKHGYDKWDFEKKYTFQSTAGTQFILTLEQILSLYAYAKRDQAHDHLAKGGFVFDSSIETYKEKDGKKSIRKYKVNIAKSHQISVETLEEIVSKLKPEQTAFVDEMQNYLSNVMGAKGNEVSMAMYDVKLFKEKNYFPLKSAKQFMFEQNQVAGEVRIKNSSFTNKLTPGANNPVILSNFMDVWANHVHDMSMYHSFALPIEDFNRIFNGKTRQAEGVEPVAVKSVIQEAYGPEAVDYLKQLITDLNGGARSDPRESPAKMLMGKFKKAAVFASASVVIQQPSAIVRARAMIDQKYFDINPKLISHKKLWAEVKEYAPVAVLKEMGHFDMDTGRSTVDYIKNEKNWKDKLDDALSIAPAKADEWAWVQMWAAVKKETAAKNPSMETSSEEFLKLAGKRFTEIIVKTQVYDSTLSRSANMRSKSGLMAMATAFMAEPTTSINMLEQGLREWKKGNKRVAGRYLAAVYGSVLVNSLLVSIVYAMRDDDEEKTFLEKYFSSLTTEVLDGINPLTYYPWVKDVWSILQGFDVERADMSLISDVADALTKLVKTVSTDTEDMGEDEIKAHNQNVAKAWWNFGEVACSLMGVPVKNLRRDVMAVFNTIKTAAAGHRNNAASFWDGIEESVKNALPVIGWLPDESKTDKLYQAIISGDEAYRERIEASYEKDTEAKTQNAIKSATRKALKENDPRITEAAEAYLDGDFARYKALIYEIRDEGNFVFDTIMAAFESKRNDLEKKRGLTSDAQYTPDSDESDTLFDAEAYFAAITNGDRSGAAAIKQDMLEFMDEDDFGSKLRSVVKEQYSEGNLTGSKAISMLTEHAGLEEDEASEYVQYWEFQKEHPEYDDLGKSAVAKYYEGAQPAGIDIDTYAEYIYGKSGYTKKEDIMQVIDALPITKEHKDALYYLNGWAASKLYEAPWR